ncbi:hypothetical protein [Undibacterium crateris]|uniref:hypothetical protein n=1 Tax=Undibacterium crateris TaxID=2528175 RepID=UPI001F2E2FF9|nr:hypothetical protein [Undibacterium crateris]NDI84209.1 hypothetical protein [Undibacterium crateris]
MRNERIFLYQRIVRARLYRRADGSNRALLPPMSNVVVYGKIRGKEKRWIPACAGMT